MTSMLVGLGVAQSGQVVGKIGETFGVSNLALDTQGVGDSSQVVVSGYVLPGLQVKIWWWGSLTHWQLSRYAIA